MSQEAFNFRGNDYPIENASSLIAMSYGEALQALNIGAIAQIICTVCPGIEKSMLGTQEGSIFIPNITDEEFNEFTTKFLEITAKKQEALKKNLDQVKDSVSAPAAILGGAAAIGSVASLSGQSEEDQLRSRLRELEAQKNTSSATPG